MRQYVCRPFFDPGSEELRFLPESPRLFPDGVLAWVAIQHGAESAGGSINLLRLATLENESHPLPGRVGFLGATTRDPWIFAAMERRLVVYDTEQRAIRNAGELPRDDARVVINDGLPLSTGVIFGTKHPEFRDPIAELYYWDSRDCRVTMLAPGQVCSNGKHVWEDGGQLWLADIDSASKTVRRYRLALDPPAVTDAGILLDFRDGEIFPDGMRPTPDGKSLVVAFYDPRERDSGLARQYSIATGELEAEWILPGSPRVTCPEFIELDGKVQLLFTTAVEGMPEATREIAPHAGWHFVGESGQDRLAPMTRIPI